MNEIKQIHLGRTSFTISVDAHKELRLYLDAIKDQAGANADVIDEVELRMAELLEARGIDSEKVVLPSDIIFLKEQLGTPRDFKEEDESDAESSATQNEQAPRRLFRDTDDAMIAGVAAGLARYLHVDAVIIRVVFVALVFAGGSGIFLYILLWLLVPAAKTTSERLSMEGMAATVNNLKRVAQRADVPAAAQRVSRVIPDGLRLFFKIVLALIGVGLVLGGIGSLLGTAILLVYGLMRGLQVGHATIFPVGTEQVLVLICGLVITCLVSAILIASGVALIRRKWPLPGWALAAMVGLFIAAAAVGTGLGVDSASAVRQQYDHVQLSRFIPVQTFSQVNFVGDDTVFYTIVPGVRSEVEIRTLGDINTSAITISEHNGTLTVDTTKFHPVANCNVICPFGLTNTEIIVHTPDTSGLLTSPTPPVKPMMMPALKPVPEFYR